MRDINKNIPVNTKKKKITSNENKSDRTGVFVIYVANECILPFNVKRSPQGHCQNNDWNIYVKRYLVCITNTDTFVLLFLFLLLLSTMLIIKVLVSVFVFFSKRTQKTQN